MLYDAATSLGDLDSLGLLRVTKLPRDLSWLTPIHIQMIIEVADCGEEGMRERKTQRFSEEKTDALRMLELRDILHRERDRYGKPAFLCLTWKGKEALEVLRAIERNRNKSCAARPDPIKLKGGCSECGKTDVTEAGDGAYPEKCGDERIERNRAKER